MPAFRWRVRSPSALRPPALALFVPRAVFFWVVVRVLFGVFVAVVPGQSDPAASGAVRFFSVPPPTALMIAVCVAALSLADVRALRERTFLANLGLGLSAPAAIAFVVSIALESAVAVVLGLFA